MRNFEPAAIVPTLLPRYALWHPLRAGAQVSSEDEKKLVKADDLLTDARGSSYGARLERGMPSPPKGAPVLAAHRSQLAPRARQAFDELLSGAPDKTIGVRLGLSPHTVRRYVQNLNRVFVLRGDRFEEVLGLGESGAHNHSLSVHGDRLWLVRRDALEVFDGQAWATIPAKALV